MKSGNEMNQISYEVGPDHEVVMLNELPPAHARRWDARRKAQVVAAVQAGILTIDEACTRYWLSLEEFASWQRALSAEGVEGLKAGHLAAASAATPKPWHSSASAPASPVSRVHEPWRRASDKPWQR
jgi:hypothetical protein